MSDPTLIDRLRRLADRADKRGHWLDAKTAREAAGMIARAVELGNVGVPAPPADPAPAPDRWPECITPGCRTRVDPWDHNSRCSRHRLAPDVPVTITRHTSVAP